MEVRCRTSIAGMPKVEGYLEKRGKFNLKCMWKKYWFVLDGKSLLYFKSKDSYESLGVCKGMIDFSRVQVIRIPAKLKHGFPFEIVTRSQVIYLSANDSITRDIWIEELRHATRPPQISDPFNTAKISAPHLSQLFEQVSCDPKGSINENEATPLMEQIKHIEKNTIIEENIEREMITYVNKEGNVSETNQITEQDPVTISDRISFQKSTSIPILDENLKQHNSVTSEDMLLELQNNNTKLQPTEESDGTDDGNEGSNYETAEETLETDNCFDNKNVRESYRLPYPIVPEYDLSAYCELKDIINCLEDKEVIPSINKLGRSVAVEAMKNLLHETECCK